MKWFYSCLFCAVLAVPLVNHAQSHTPDVIPVGIAAPMSGPIAHLGKDIDSGARLAFRQINNSGLVINGKKVRFDLITVDDQSDPKVATQVANLLVDRKVVAVIGHYNSGTSIPASRIYAAHGIVQITPGATNPLLTHQGYKTVFRTIANDNQQGQVLADFAFDRLAARQIAVIDDGSAGGQGQANLFSALFKRRGGKIIDREFTTQNAVDFTSILIRIKRHRPDLIFFGGLDVQAGPLVRQMKTLKMEVRVLGTDGMQSNVFTRLAGDAAVGHYASSVGLPKTQMPRFGPFAAAFSADYGDMQAYAPYSYDAAMIIVEAVKQADSARPADFVKKIRTMNYPGVTGTITFDDNGDINRGVITVYQVNESGQWQPAMSSGEAIR